MSYLEEIRLIISYYIFGLEARFPKLQPVIDTLYFYPVTSSITIAAIVIVGATLYVKRQKR